MNSTDPGPSLALPGVALQRTRFNPPGQSRLTYEGGAFLPTLDRMLLRLARQAIPGPPGASASAPFADFNLEAADDWSVALLHAWAAVTDVLGFYHERIVNEGYLRTATERFSVIQLARAVGYELQPGLAASAMLVLTVTQGAGEPPQSVFVPKGTAVQSVPPPKSGLHQGAPASALPQIFETSDDFVARSEWNLLRPAALGELIWEHRLLPGLNSLRLLGNRTDLKKGDRLLFVGQDPAVAQRRLWRMAEVVSTTPNIARGFTVVAWQNAPGMPAYPLPWQGPYAETGDDDGMGHAQAIAAPQLFVLRQKARLFPYAATGVYRTWLAEAPDGPAAGEPAYCWRPQWWPAGIGLPHEAVELMTMTRSGHLLVVTKKDMVRSQDAGASWQPTGAGLAGKHVTALAIDEDGALYAGTDKGEVHLSHDEGETWRQAAGSPVRLPVRGLGKLIPPILRSSGHLPEVVVSSLAAYRSGNKQVLAAGADSGVFLSTDRGRSWKAANLVMPKLDRKTGMAPVQVRALAALQTGKRRALYAGTDAGVFPVRPTPSATPVLLAGLLLALLYRLLLNPGGILTKTVYQTVVGFIQLAGTTAANLLSKLPDAIATIPLVGNPIATPAAKLIGNLDKSILTPIAQLPTSIPGPTSTATPALTASATVTATAAATATPAATATVTQTAATAANGVANSATPLSLPNPIGAALGLADQYPVLWLLADAALIAAAIGVVLAAWWLVWRYLNNRPGRRIAAPPPPAPASPALPGKLPSEKELAAKLAPKHPPIPVQALQASASGLFAGTTQGVYHAARPGPQPHDKGLRRLWSRLRQLVFPGLLSGWTHLDSGLAPQPTIETLAVQGEDLLLASTSAGQIFRYHSVDTIWQPGQPDANPAPLTGVAAIVPTPDGLFLGGAPSQAKVDPQWSPWQVQSRAVHLDAVHDGIAPGSWLVLESAGDAQNGSPAARPRLYQVAQAGRLDSFDAVKRGSFTRVLVDRDDGLAHLDRTLAQGLFQSESLELYDDHPVYGTTIQLSRAVGGLKPGQPVVVSGKRMRVRLVAPAGAAATLTTADGLQTALVQPGESLVLLQAPPPLGAAQQGNTHQQHDANPPSPGAPSQERAAQTWRVQNRDGLAGQVVLPAVPAASVAQFVVEPPLEEDPEVSELALVYGMDDDPALPTVTLTTDMTGHAAQPRPLANIFERPTVTIRANVVAATHGAGVPAEVLGSSDGAQGNQRFTLRQAPLTYVSSDTPGGAQSTLTITVAGVRWRQAPFLYGLPRDQRAFALQRDEQDRVTITFGDGRSGARLPSTREEVQAAYRVGIGQAGNVRAGSLSQLRAAPPGLAGVTNPLPASGGVDPESSDSIRANAPLGLRAMQRIVSMSDYEDFVRSFAGIGRAQAKFFPRVQGGLLHITVADGDGGPVDPTSALFGNLLAAVDQARVAPVPKIQIDSFEALYFDVIVRLIVNRDDQARQSLIEQQARQALSDAFTFQRRAFAQAVSAAEIINLLQPIAGVVGVEIERLAYRPPDAADASPAAPVQAPTDVTAASEPGPLAAHPARLRNRVVLPAQLLLINRASSDGITIKTEVMR